MIRDANRARIVYPALRGRPRTAAVTSVSLITVSDSSYCSVTNDNLFYVPWGNESEAFSGAVDEEVAFIPPFGANTTIVRVNLVFEVAVGSTTVTIRDFDETILATSIINISGAETLFEIDFDYALSDSVPIIFGIDPTLTPQSVRFQVIAQETT